MFLLSVRENESILYKCLVTEINHVKRCFGLSLSVSCCNFDHLFELLKISSQDKVKVIVSKESNIKLASIIFCNVRFITSISQTNHVLVISKVQKIFNFQNQWVEYRFTINIFEILHLISHDGSSFYWIDNGYLFCWPQASLYLK